MKKRVILPMVSLPHLKILTHAALRQTHLKSHAAQEARHGVASFPALAHCHSIMLTDWPWLAKCSFQANPLEITCGPRGLARGAKFPTTSGKIQPWFVH